MENSWIFEDSKESLRWPTEQNDEFCNKMNNGSLFNVRRTPENKLEIDLLDINNMRRFRAKFKVYLQLIYPRSKKLIAYFEAKEKLYLIQSVNKCIEHIGNQRNKIMYTF